MSLLSIVQAASLRCNIAVPSTCIGNNDPTVQQFVAFSQDAGDEMAERWTWPSMRRPGALSTPSGQSAQIIGDGTTTIFALPDDWGRFSPSDVLTSSLYPTLTLTGPVNEEDLLRFKQLPFTPLPSIWHLIGDPSAAAGGPPPFRWIEFYPAPASAEVISFVYGSLRWISSGGVLVQSWTTDSDLPLIPSRIVQLGTIWRWKRAKGLSYAEEFTMCERTFDRMAGQQSERRTIRMTTEPVRGDWWPGAVTDLTGGDPEWT